MNVIVRKPASKGYEDAPVVMLEGHMDMVCVKTPESTHDFSHDPIEIYVDDKGDIRAKDTTLGADDGYGVAYMLAVMEEDFPTRRWSSSLRCRRKTAATAWTRWTRAS